MASIAFCDALDTSIVMGVLKEDAPYEKNRVNNVSIC
jgi:hypothetical protein